MSLMGDYTQKLKSKNQDVVLILLAHIIQTVGGVLFQVPLKKALFGSILLPMESLNTLFLCTMAALRHYCIFSRYAGLKPRSVIMVCWFIIVTLLTLLEC